MIIKIINKKKLAGTVAEMLLGFSSGSPVSYYLSKS